MAKEPCSWATLSAHSLNLKRWPLPRPIQMAILPTQKLDSKQHQDARRMDFDHPKRKAVRHTKQMGIQPRPNGGRKDVNRCELSELSVSCNNFTNYVGNCSTLALLCELPQKNCRKNITRVQMIGTNHFVNHPLRIHVISLVGQKPLIVFFKVPLQQFQHFFQWLSPGPFSFVICMPKGPLRRRSFGIWHFLHWMGYSPTKHWQTLEI